MVDDFVRWVILMPFPCCVAHADCTALLLAFEAVVIAQMIAFRIFEGPRFVGRRGEWSDVSCCSDAAFVRGQALKTSYWERYNRPATIDIYWCIMAIDFCQLADFLAVAHASWKNR